MNFYFSKLTDEELLNRFCASIAAFNTPEHVDSEECYALRAEILRLIGIGRGALAPESQAKEGGGGVVNVEWSDRKGLYDPSDPESIVDVVLACCLDHRYDRTHNGIPYGMDDALSAKLYPVLQRWFLDHHPEWFTKTVHLEDGEREALKNVLIARMATSGTESAGKE